MHVLAEIYLPECDNAGLHNTSVHEALQARLLDMFGGYTRVPRCDGAWRGPNDTIKRQFVSIYRVLVENNPHEEARIGQLAMDVATFARQAKVMTVFNGRVELVHPWTERQAQARFEGAAL